VYGFTLIELIFVLAIICIALAVSAPEFRGFLSGQTTKNVANKIVALARHGRALAISEGRTYRLSVDTSSGTFWLDAQVGAEFKDLGTSNGQHFQIPDGTKAKWYNESGAEVVPAAKPVQQQGTTAPGLATLTGTAAPQGQAQQTGECVQFFSDGRCDMLSLRLTGRNDSEIELGAPSESEMWRVAKDGQP